MNITNIGTFVSPRRICRFCIHVHYQAAGSRVTLTYNVSMKASIVFLFQVPCQLMIWLSIDPIGLLWKPINALIQINRSLHPFGHLRLVPDQSLRPTPSSPALPPLWAIIRGWDFPWTITIDQRARLHMMSFSVYTNDCVSRVAKINDIKWHLKKPKKQQLAVTVVFTVGSSPPELIG